MLRVAAFDSGVGGLTAIAPLLKLPVPVEVTYLGDLANLPYGTKSAKRIRELTKKNLTWLLRKSPEAKKHFDLCVIACNTACAHAFSEVSQLTKKIETPLLGVIEPGCRMALESKHTRIVVLATTATVKSRAYSRALKKADRTHVVLEQACPLFVPLVEDGLTQSATAETVIKNYLDPILQPQDSVILGCTHYPFLEPSLRKLYPDVEWINAGAALVHDPIVQKLLASKKASLGSKKQKAKLTVYFTDKTAGHSKLHPFLTALNLRNITYRLKYIDPR